MKTTQSHFLLQQIITDCVQAVQQNTDTVIQSIDDLAAPILLSGYPQNLELLLNLLLKNAVNAPSEKITLTTKQLLQTEKEVLLEFCIVDELEKEIESEEKDRTYNDATLLEAERMIAAMGGQSERINTRGAGVGIMFLLKYEQYRPTTADKKDVVHAVSRLAGKRILVADDNEINQIVIAQFLKKEGLQVDVAIDGKAAIDLLEKEDYDLVIMDIHMPHMDGFEATRYIRKRLGSDVPIIALTSRNDEDMQAECIKSGMNGYITKPIGSKKLIGLMHTYLISEQPSLQNEFQVIRPAV